MYNRAELCLNDHPQLAGPRGLVVTALGSGDRGFKSRLRLSVFFSWLFLLLLSFLLSLPTLCLFLSLTMPVVTCSSVFDLSWGRQKREESQKSWKRHL